MGGKSHECGALTLGGGFFAGCECRRRLMLDWMRGGNLRPVRTLEGCGGCERLLHAGPTDAAGRLGGASAAPVGFQRNGVTVADGFERAKLCRPVDEADVDGRPLDFSGGGVAGGVLAVAMEDAIFRQQLPASGE